jgi:hypothetical protein
VEAQAMNAVETEEYKGLNIKICQDEDASNPRRDWDNFGKMVCAHRRYDLGDENMEPEDILAITERKDVLYLPLYLYDHGGITMNTGGFNCPWDSGQVGIIYADRGMIRKEYGRSKFTKALKAKVYAILESEVKTYDMYLTGEVYGYEVEDPDGEEDGDSCWGFYGLDYCMEEAKSIADHIAGRKARKKALGAMENYLDNRPEVLAAGERLQAAAI